MARLKIGNDRRGGEPVPRPGEIARGDYWSIVREGDDYVLCYLSTELLGREKRLILHEREARDIAYGRIPVEAYLTPAALPALDRSSGGPTKASIAGTNDSDSPAMLENANDAPPKHLLDRLSDAPSRQR